MLRGILMLLAVVVPMMAGCTSAGPLRQGERFVEVNGVKLWHKVAGKGPVLVVQPPGWGMGAAYLEQTFKPLEESTTVVYFETRGSGRSERPESTESLNVGQMVEDLEVLRRHWGLEKLALLGHSHGGYIAMNYALKYPEHVNCLILVGAKLDGVEMTLDLERNLLRMSQEPKYADAARAWGAWSKVKTDEDFMEWLMRLQPLYFCDPDHGMAVWKKLELDDPALTTANAIWRSDDEFRVLDSLRRIDVPTLILVGRHDFLTTPRQAEIMQHRIAGSKLVVFENSGHYPWIEEPGAFFKQVESFIKKHSAM